MLTVTVTYTDFLGESQTEELQFHLSEREVLALELELEPVGGIEGVVEKFEQDGKAFPIMALFEKVILMSYGKRSEDGRRFIKNDEVLEEFKTSAAYDQLFVDLLMTDETGKAAIKFFEGVVPTQNKAKATQ